MIFFKFLSIFFVVSGILIALVILADIQRHRQPMKIMEAVWPLTGLWSSWLGLWAYYRWGRTPAIPKENNQPEHSMMMAPGMEMNHKDMAPAFPHANLRSTALSTLHCGAGCTLADIAGEWFVFFVPFAIGGSILAGQWVLDYVLALIIGIFFQYAAIRPMEHLSAQQTVVKALKADFLSLTAWQIGMYGWMAITIFVIFPYTPLPKTSWEFWFMMQIAMCAGFLTSFPVNRFLIQKGIKHGM